MYSQYPVRDAIRLTSPYGECTIVQGASGHTFPPVVLPRRAAPLRPPAPHHGTASPPWHTSCTATPRSAHAEVRGPPRAAPARQRPSQRAGRSRTADGRRAQRVRDTSRERAHCRTPSTFTRSDPCHTCHTASGHHTPRRPSHPIACTSPVAHTLACCCAAACSTPAAFKYGRLRLAALRGRDAHAVAHAVPLTYRPCRPRQWAQRRPDPCRIGGRRCRPCRASRASGRRPSRRRRGQSARRGSSRPGAPA